MDRDEISNFAVKSRGCFQNNLKTPDKMRRIEREKRTVAQMIQLYCRGKEGNKQLCPECAALTEYARMRLSKCPFGDGKSSCRKCSIHCYSPAMKQRIKEVMRYSGPRMMLYHPIAAIRHLISELK